MLRVVDQEAVEDGMDGRSLLDEIAREGARPMLMAALEGEVAAYVEARREERDDQPEGKVNKKVNKMKAKAV